MMRLHGSCASIGDDAVLLLGAPGAGKSDLLLRLIDRGFDLIGDDQLIVENGKIRSAETLEGMIELRGLGMFASKMRAMAQLRLVARLGNHGIRLPFPQTNASFGVPEIAIDPWTASAPIRIHWALDAVCGRRQQFCGSFVV